MRGNQYRRDPNKSGGGTQLLHDPPTAHMVHSIKSLAVVDDTLGGYNWHHRPPWRFFNFHSEPRQTTLEAQKIE